MSYATSAERRGQRQRVQHSKVSRQKLTHREGARDDGVGGPRREERVGEAGEGKLEDREERRRHHEAEVVHLCHRR